MSFCLEENALYANISRGSNKDLFFPVTDLVSKIENFFGNGYQITRSYFTLTGEAVDLTQVVAGTRLVVVLKVSPFARGEARLMVADPLPAGFEIDNPNLMTAGSIASLDWLSTETDVAHAEFRQDRFLTAIDRYGNSPFELAYIVRAVSPGVFHHPAASVEDMYRPEYRARTDAGTVTIIE